MRRVARQGQRLPKRLRIGIKTIWRKINMNADQVVKDFCAAWSRGGLDFVSQHFQIFSCSDWG